MRLWSVHPKYLDTKGLVALWREGLGALKSISEKVGYSHHPQLIRFRNTSDPVQHLSNYMYYIHDESINRGFKFNKSKLPIVLNRDLEMTVTSEQLHYEWNHLQRKLEIRDPRKFQSNVEANSAHKFNPVVQLYKIMHDQDLIHIEPHPMFSVISGEIESWEKVG